MERSRALGETATVICMLMRLLPLLAASASLLSGVAAPMQWDWIQPLPHRQNWIDLTAGTNGFVCLTEGYGGRFIYHSTNGTNWEIAITPQMSGYTLKRVKFLNGNFIAVGNRDTILSSTDGVDWQTRHTDPAGTLLWDITYGNGTYVAVGYNSEALFSKDLKTWTPLDFPKGSSLLNVEFGNGVFLAVASSGIIYRSSDGRVWETLPWPAGFSLDVSSSFESGFAFHNGVFVLSQGGGTITTSDGANWNFGPNIFYRKITATDSGFVASSGDSLAISADGIHWQTTLSIPNNSGALFPAVAKLNNMWLAGGASGALYGSTDGQTWNAIVGPVDYSQSEVAYANGKFIRYGSEPGNFISNDGSNWTHNSNAPALTALAGGNRLWVGITPENKAAISPDALSWREVSLPAQAYGELLFANGSFISAADGGVLISTDGEHWDLVSIPNINSIRLIGFQNGVFAAVSDASQPLTSADGRNWTIHAANSASKAQFYAAGNGHFIGIGTSGLGPGEVTLSTDGVNWQRQSLTSGSTFPFTGLAFGGGNFVMIDNSGGIYSSTNGLDWTGGPQAAQPFTGAAYAPGTWVVTGGDSILRSTAMMAARATAKLQLTQSNLANWTLMVTGSPGEHWQIESAVSLTAPWQLFQTVDIPVTGTTTVPLTPQQTAAFFRAVIQP